MSTPIAIALPSLIAIRLKLSGSLRTPHEVCCRFETEAALAA
jgi:hypothetical protein